jgi:hypothetical protein
MQARRPVLVAAALTAIAFIAIGGLTFLVFEQHTANQQILSELDRLRVSLDQQTSAARELSDQVGSLSGRIVELERDNKDLRRQLASVQRRRPVDVTPNAEPAPLLESSSTPLYAEHAGIEEPATLVATLPITWSTEWTSYQPAGIVAPPPQAAVSRKFTDPAFVKKMYASYAALQAADIITTTRALDRGAREANPLARGYVSSPARMIAVKAGVTVATILITERIRKKHPVPASVMLVALNATLAAVVINNAGVPFDP